MVPAAAIPAFAIASAGGAIVTLRDLVEVPPPASLTRAVNENVPAVLGVPEMTPEGFIDRPFGRLPDSFNHVYDGVPPAAFREAEYTTPTVPLGSAPVVTESAGEPIVMVSPLVAAELPESVTVAVKVNCPAPVGVPDIDPFGAIDKPPGKLPEARDHK